MVVHEVEIEHEGTAHQLEFDTEDGLEVLRFQLFSLTMVAPENQIILDSSKIPIENDTDLLAKLAPGSGKCTFSLLDETLKASHDKAVLEMEKADEELAQLLQAEEEALYLAQEARQDGRHEFASRVKGYISQVLQYEDPPRQAKAHETVQLDELEEKAMVALAKDGKRNPSVEELEHCILFQLLQWFKKSFRWINSAPCFLCGADTDGIGMGQPTNEELQFGGNRVELYRCKLCHCITRFPRYNDTLKLLETRSGRCGEWANCFTLYCRAFGYQARLVLAFTDHMWTECFSKFLGRWIHLDPCEGAFDKPLLYEDGWGQKLTYIIAVSSDGVFDVTKRYTKYWEEVRLRRTLTSEENVDRVVTDLTAQLRHTFSKEILEQLSLRDAVEAAELTRIPQEEDKVSLAALPGRQTGSTEWRKARGELGSSITPIRTQSPKRPCVDHFVSEIFLALGDLNVMQKEAPSVLRNKLESLLKILKKLQKSPYRARQVLFLSLNVADTPPLSLNCNSLQRFFAALGLLAKENGTDKMPSPAFDPVDTALALPVAIENLETMIDLTKSSEGLDVLFKQLAFYAEYERLSGAWAQASGEEPPFGIASSAFDGMQSTKWEEPEGAKGSWLTYFLLGNSKTKACCYEIISANDCPERDPKDWVLEGSDDCGCTWNVLDTRTAQFFNSRFERKHYVVSQNKDLSCDAFRLRFQGVRESLSQSRLQLSCVNFYKKK